MSNLIDLAVDFFSNGITRATGWQVFIFTMVVTHITIASVTIFLHRCQAHRALELHAIPSHFFRFWLWLTTGQVTKEWAAVHRKHHAKCETEEDPHSPVTRGIKKVLFEGAELYRIESKNMETIAKYGHGTPDDWMERNVYTRFSWQGVALMLIIDLFLFGAIGVTVWAVQMMWIPVTAAGIINGIGHYWGYRNYECKRCRNQYCTLGHFDRRRRNCTIIIILLARQLSCRPKWYEFDIGWGYIRALETRWFGKSQKSCSPAEIRCF